MDNKHPAIKGRYLVYQFADYNKSVNLSV